MVHGGLCQLLRVAWRLWRNIDVPHIVQEAHIYVFIEVYQSYATFMAVFHILVHDGYQLPYIFDVVLRIRLAVNQSLVIIKQPFIENRRCLSQCRFIWRLCLHTNTKESFSLYSDRLFHGVLVLSLCVFVYLWNKVQMQCLIFPFTILIAVKV